MKNSPLFAGLVLLAGSTMAFVSINVSSAASENSGTISTETATLPKAGAASADIAPADPALLDAANKASGVLSPSATDPRNAPNTQPAPYTSNANFFKLPPGRKMGATSGVAVDSQGHIWIADRCGTTDCAGSNVDPIMEFDSQGNYLKSFGAGRFLFPHGFTIDGNDHVWVTDSGCTNPPGVVRTPAFLAACTNGHVGDGKGNEVVEFDHDGKLLLTLGMPGVVGNGPTKFDAPSAVQVAVNGTIFVSDSHDAGVTNNARIVKFDATGRFLGEWGSHGIAAGQFDGPHCLAMDSKGRLYVGDRWNNRIQVFDQDGKLLQILTQFGRPSGIYIDKNDILYATDSESRVPYGYGYHPGWSRGVRIGSVGDGIVTAFIPDTEKDTTKITSSGGEGVWADNNGVVYSAEPRQRDVVRYVRN